LEVVLSGFNKEGVKKVSIGEGSEGELRKFMEAINDLLILNGNEGVVTFHNKHDNDNSYIDNNNNNSNNHNIKSRHNAGNSNSSNFSNENKCVICLSKAPNTLLLNCRHLCVCNVCSENVDTCPICRSVVAERVVVILPR